MDPVIRPFLFFFILLGLRMPVLFAQSILDQKVNLVGRFPLNEALDSLQKRIPIAYSPDRLPNKEITIEEGVDFKFLFNNLKDQKLLEYRMEGDQVIISPYKIKKYTINGILKDIETGENIIGATIQVVGTPLGTITNGYGYYSITLTEGTYQLKFTHVGYSPYTSEIILDKNIYLKINITPNVIELREVKINAFTEDTYVLGDNILINKISITETDGQIPYFLGEVDVIQNVLMQPGIRTIGENASGIHVRGGDVDQNLTLLDEATIYNPNHFYGLISVFNPEAVNDIRIIKGYIPPSYGGRSSSIIEVKQKEGNSKKISYSGGIGVLSARGLIEGPVKKGKGSFLLSGRQSLLNLSIDDFASTSVRRNKIHFQDINMKINLKPNTRNTYYLSGYYGNDRNTVDLNTVRNWGNRMLNFRWNHLSTSKIFSNFSSFVSKYNYRIKNDEEPGAFIGTSQITDYSIKSDITYYFDPKSEINFGFSTILHRLSPGSREPFKTATNTNRIELEKEQGLESALYIGHDRTIGKVGFNFGLRYSMFHNLGPGTVFIYENDQPVSDTKITDTIHHQNLEVISAFQNIEPRATINWLINHKTSIKASYSKSVQYIHLISNTVSPSPTDIWKLSNDYIPPLTSEEYTFGLFKNMKDNIWRFSSELYFKTIRNNIQYRNGADLVFNENIETELLLSRGRAYGLELYLKKRTGIIKGWISYTLSRSERKLNNNPNTKFVLDNHNKTHDFSTSWNIEVSPRMSAAVNFVFNTGIPITLPTDKYVFSGNLIPHFGDRNNARLPNYHRLDLSLRLNGKKLKKDGRERKNRDYWILSIYNIYARKNAYSYFYRESKTHPGLGEIVEYSIFGTIIPAITYNFKF